MNPLSGAPPVPVSPAPDQAAVIPFGQCILLLAPFYLNDLANIFLHDAGLWLLQDYLVRLAVVGFVWHLARRDLISTTHWWARGVSRPAMFGWTLAAMAAGLLLIPGPGRLLLDLLPETRLGSIPFIPPGWMEAMDLSAGLALVAISEELVFRGVLQARLSAYFQSKPIGLLSTAILFGLVHWSNGLGSVLQTALVGFAFGLCVMRGRSLLPVILAHYVADLLVFL